MHTFSTWNVDASQILTRRELGRVFADLHARAPRLVNVHLNLAIARLACCCGLHAGEIGGLRLADVRVGIARPYIQVRAACAKGTRTRRTFPGELYKRRPERRKKRRTGPQSPGHRPRPCRAH